MRQILHGKRYFIDKFGVEPRTAINFDPFGHDRGLVQIMAAGGYDGYVICRPDQGWWKAPADTFRWRGRDGSEVVVCRPGDFYSSPLGKAHEKIGNAIKETPATGHRLLLWGVGNHGGGPSRLDLERITALIGERTDWEIRHATPEGYIAALTDQRAALPVVDTDLRPWGVGCYISMVQVKQRYRELENELFATEKLLAFAAGEKLLAYPVAEMAEACRDLLLAQFHDSLPGSGVEAVERMVLRTLDHGLEIVSRLRARALFALAETQPRAADGELPVLVANPHPFPIDVICTAEMMLADQNHQATFTDLEVTCQGRSIPAQVEQEASSLNLDWRKRVTFRARLEPSSLTRFSCRTVPRPVPAAPPAVDPARRSGGFAGRPAADGGSGERRGEHLIFTNQDGLDFAVNLTNGQFDLAVSGQRQLAGAGTGLVLQDDADPWGMRCRGWTTVLDRFRLMTATEAGRFAGVTEATLAPVRVIEDGPVRTVVESLWTIGTSHLRQRLEIPRRGTAIGLEIRVHWMETDRLLKLELPFAVGLGQGWRFLGEGAAALSDLPTNGEEAVLHRYRAVDDGQGSSLGVITTGTYAADCTEQRLRLTLLRSPAYCAHPIGDRPLVPQDRHNARMDQGVRTFRFVLEAGPTTERLARLPREADQVNQPPTAINIFPGGSRADRPLSGGLSLDDATVAVLAVKRSEDGAAWIIRLLEPTGTARSTRLRWPAIGLDHRIDLPAWRLLSLRVDDRGQVTACDLLERVIQGA